MQFCRFNTVGYYRKPNAFPYIHNIPTAFSIEGRVANYLVGVRPKFSNAAVRNMISRMLLLTPTFSPQSVGRD